MLVGLESLPEFDEAFVEEDADAREDLLLRDLDRLRVSFPSVAGQLRFRSTMEGGRRN